MLSCLCLVAASVAEAASARGELQQCLNQIRVDQSVPGALLATNQQSLKSGVADLESGAPLRSQDRFRIGSNTKTFVATVVLQLVAERKLSLDDILADLLEAEVANLPNADQITVRQLLNMTSGVFDYNDPSSNFLQLWYDDPDKVWNPQEIIDFVAQPQYSPYFAPGTSCGQCPGNCVPDSQCWHYSNTNYILLGRIIEKVTGRSLEQELRTRLFEPLGLRDTSFPSTTNIRGQHSRGYMSTQSNGKPVQVDCPLVDSGQLYDTTDCLSPTAAWAAGAIVSSVRDLRIWLAALIEGTLLPPGLQRERLTLIRGSLDGLPVEYGLGIMRIHDARVLAAFRLPPFSSPPQAFLGHGGEFQGYASVMLQAERCGQVQIIDAVNLFPQAPQYPIAYLNLFLAADGILCHAMTCEEALQAQGLPVDGAAVP
jgi:D-alanyl-D-alanine carboxypeptidase